MRGNWTIELDAGRKLVVAADAHLGMVPGDVETMIRFVDSLDPAVCELLFLGDLFQIWAGPEKYHTAPVKKLLPILRRFREQGGRVHLVVGNRDVFFPAVPPAESAPHLPFDTICGEFLTLRQGDRVLMAFHGDTVNRLDRRYLRWRRWVRHPLMEKAFDLLPPGWVQRVMFNLEGQLKESNPRFKRSFPVNEWKCFVRRLHREYAPDLILAGHFHPDEPVVHTVGTTCGIVLPDWLGHRAYLEIDGGIDRRICFFEADTPSG